MIIVADDAMAFALNSHGTIFMHLKILQQLILKTVIEHSQSARLVQADWRGVLPRIGIPCLNVVAKQTRCFKREGVEYVSKHIPKCKTVCYMHSDTELAVPGILNINNQQLKCVELEGLMVVVTCLFGCRHTLIQLGTGFI